MLKITVQNEQPTRMVLEGNLAGAWVEEAKRGWHRGIDETSGQLLVDLTGVAYIDPDGRLLLVTMWQEGADLQATGCYTRTVLQEISTFQRGGSSKECSKDTID